MITRIDVRFNFKDSASHQAFIDDVKASKLTPDQYLLKLLDIALTPLKVNDGFDISNPLGSLGYTTPKQ